MLKNFRATYVLFFALACAGPVFAAADPTMDQVYQTLRAGHVAQAEQMMSQVLRDHPQSAKAHYVAAQVYARAGDAPLARQELSTAQALEPGLPFVRAESLQALQRELATGQAVRMRPGVSNPRPSFSMGTVLLILGGVLVLWLVFRRRAQPANVYPQYPGAVPAGAGGMGPGYAGGGMGSGIGGALASGLAVGAGVVAGEELTRHFLDRPPGALPDTGEPAAQDNGDVGGNDFGVSGRDSSWDDGGGSDGGDVGGGDWT